MAEIIGILEIIGTIAFAISGALVAISAYLDLFGVIFVGCITAFGGGILRDLIIGVTPPRIFLNYRLCLVAITASALVFVFAYFKRKSFGSLKGRIEHINNIFDALGLAAFSITGAEIGFGSGFGDNGFIIIALGMITGVGGGIFRDVLTDTTPYVFKKHIYAIASIAGSTVYFILRLNGADISLCSVISMVIVVTIRMLAAKFRLSLPKIHLEDETKK